MTNLSRIEDEVRNKVRRLGAIGARVSHDPRGLGALDEAMPPEGLHVALNAFNRARLQPSVAGADAFEELAFMHAAAWVEARFLQEERQRVQPELAGVPRDVTAFVRWFERQKAIGCGQHDPLFEFLATEATRAEMTWFLRQEYCGEVGFDDLIALTQVRMPRAVKLELARNFWDEMGHGEASGMHAPMYADMVRELGIHDTPDEAIVWEGLALCNLLTGLACNRHYVWGSLGALSMIELTSPTRASRVVAGLARLELSDRATRYFELHATLDVSHWNAWRDNALLPLLAEHPELMVPIAEGALLRLHAAGRLFRRYRAELGLDDAGRRVRAPRIADAEGEAPC